MTTKEAAEAFMLHQNCDTCAILERCRRERYCMEVFKEAYDAGEIDLRGRPIKQEAEK